MVIIQCFGLYNTDVKYFETIADFISKYGYEFIWAAALLPNSSTAVYAFLISYDRSRREEDSTYVLYMYFADS